MSFYMAKASVQVMDILIYIAECVGSHYCADSNSMCLFCHRPSCLLAYLFIMLLFPMGKHDDSKCTPFIVYL